MQLLDAKEKFPAKADASQPGHKGDAIWPRSESETANGRPRCEEPASAGLGDHPHPAVAAEVVERPHAALEVAHQEERSVAQHHRHRVSGLGDLAPNPYRGPAAREKQAILKLVELLAVDRPRQPAGFSRGPVEFL